ncbi:hypothetical protein DNTS_033079 [Danionella cerebrum]|uniref:Myb-like, SWIRM and MPN domain-containing protein 1 n=1 Tax=Danionella cerebrum TaxID=2873325 RepID=A0A553NMT6_9TELE|nr:hypothetical protein DNTS_033079 [Danionella translucida]
MAEELDVVDIEGDVCDETVGDLNSAEILQDQFLQSAWKTNNSLLPWTLDSSISDENREAIESMLLEEQYYFSSKKAPKVAWTSEKTKIKRPLVRTSGAQSRWAEDEKDLFEKGLAQFGRRWTKIAKLIGTRTVLQVKSYARQYFKNNPVTDLPQEESSSEVTPETTSFPVLQPPVPALANAVRIERLSDDEDVDITDDFGEENQPQPSSYPEPDPDEEHSPVQTSSDQPQEINPPPESKPIAVDGHRGPDGKVPRSLFVSELDKECGNDLHKTNEVDCSDEDEEELRAPEQEVELDRNTITEEEKQAIPEFFEGRPSKTPERYLKIRNYILEQWVRSKPSYLNKTSVRPGLKNCGDVNCIGRIHTYLELIGAINFSCDQAVYNRPRLVDRSRLKESKDRLEAYHLAQRLQSMRTRKRRIRDVWGNWCDAKDLEGQTYEHLSAEELAARREEMKRTGLKPSKTPKHRGSFDPFQLIPCSLFGEERQEPYRVVVCAEALILMDIHAHVSMGEVIGLLGGTFEEEEKELKICAAEPCNSLSTGLQCEMDPVSQTQASEQLGVKGYSVVGWYHSHPSFEPNPSLRDIDTQAKYQSYFSRGGAPFVGMIISPYNPQNPSLVSQSTCLVVQEEPGPLGPQKLPYQFDVQLSSETPDWTEVTRRVEWVVQKYRLSHGSVSMNRLYRRDSSLTCLKKMLGSVRKTMEKLSEIDTETFLVELENMFKSHFIPEAGTSSSHLQEAVDSESQDVLFTAGLDNHVKKYDEDEDTPVTYFISEESV